MDTSTKLWFLGAPRAEYAGQPVQSFESRKALALLGYLAARGEAIPRSQLAALFWPDQPDERGRANLRHLLHTLSAQLPGTLATTRQTVQLLDTPACWIDLATFEGCATQDTLAGLGAAADLYRGAFLDGVYLDDCPDVEIWLAQERERWHERAAHVLAGLSMRARERQEWVAGLRAVDRLLALDPWREAAHQEKMRLLALSGQRDTALAQYEACRRILADELGIDPSPETTALYEQIRDGLLTPPVVSPPQRFRVPIPPTPLLGREQELEQMTHLLAQPNCRLLTVLGPGGVGKTRLALEVAGQQQTHFDDGVCVVELAAIHNPSQVAPAIAQALGIQEADAHTAGERLNIWLSNKQILLYLDNFEQILPAASLVRDLLARNPRLKVIVTSRTPLHLRGEQEFPIGPLALPDLRDFTSAAIDSSELVIAHAATALFVERAQSVDPGFTVTPEQAPFIAAICARLDGLPLAIELAAARSKLFSPSALLARLERRLPVLKGNVQDRLPHQQTIRDTIAWSEQLLTAPEQLLFARLSVFVGGWTLEMAEAVVVLETDQAGSLDVVDSMARLVDHSLVLQHKTAGGEPRFAMLETIREYALERLADQDAAVDIRGKHLRFLCALAEVAEPELFAASQRQWFARLITELANLRAALDWSLTSATIEPGLRLAGSLWWFWLTQGVHQEGRAYLRHLLAQAEQANASLALAKARVAVGFLEWARADYGAAQLQLEQALWHSRILGNRQIEAWSLTFLGMVATNQNLYAKASQLLAESVNLWRSIGDTIGLSWALMFGGDLANAQGDDIRAAVQYQESIALLRALGSNIPLAYPLRQLGHLEQRRGNSSTAIAHWKESLVLTSNVGDTRAVAACLVALATTVVKSQGERAARLLGAANRALERIAITPLPADRSQEEPMIKAIHAQLGETTFRAAWAAGWAMSLQQAVDDALALEAGDATAGLPIPAAQPL